MPVATRKFVGRPENPLAHVPELTPFEPAPSIQIAYPGFEDWTGLYDPVNQRGQPWQREMQADMRRSHKKSVLHELGCIARYAVGRAVLAEMTANAGHSVRIYPYDFLPRQNFNAGTIAVTTANNERAAWVKDAPLAGANSRDARYVQQGDDGAIITGTGEGSDTRIFFTARRHQGTDSADDVLLHELTHATRKVRGVVYRMPVSGGYGNLEEFLATLVANMYRSEKKLQQVHDYHGVNIDPARFLESPLRPTPRLLIATFRARQPQFFAALARIDLAFNPIRQVDTEHTALLRRIESA